MNKRLPRRESRTQIYTAFALPAEVRGHTTIYLDMRPKCIDQPPKLRKQTIFRQSSSGIRIDDCLFFDLVIDSTRDRQIMMFIVVGSIRLCNLIGKPLILWRIDRKSAGIALQVSRFDNARSNCVDWNPPRSESFHIWICFIFF